MRVRFGNEDLALVETNQAHRLKLPVEVVQTTRRRLRFLRQARDERDIYAMVSLHYEQLIGDRQGQRSIRLNGKWRIILEIDRECDPMEIVILEVSNHYG